MGVSLSSVDASQSSSHFWLGLGGEFGSFLGLLSSTSKLATHDNAAGLYEGDGKVGGEDRESGEAD